MQTLLSQKASTFHCSSSSNSTAHCLVPWQINWPLLGSLYNCETTKCLSLAILFKPAIWARGTAASRTLDIDGRKVSIPTGLFINNEFVPSLAGNTFGVENPKHFWLPHSEVSIQCECVCDKYCGWFMSGTISALTTRPRKVYSILEGLKTIAEKWIKHSSK